MSSIVIDSPIGFIEITGTAAVISSVIFFMKPPTPTADKTPLLLFKAANQFQEYFAGSRKKFDLAIERKGTPFQEKIWTELCKIPFGETIKYLELAKRVGHLNTFQSALAAVGKNKISLIIPSHRVIGNDGGLAKNEGGQFRQDWLLRMEGGWPNTPQLSLFE